MMKIAIPLANGKLAMHFGHCEKFALIDIDAEEKKVIKHQEIDPPAHEPGLLPPWLANQGANVIIAGGMGERAQSMFVQQGIRVLVGAEAAPLEHIVTQYLDGTLQLGSNSCDH